MDEENIQEQVNNHINVLGLLNGNINERFERINSSDEEVFFSSSHSSDDDEDLIELLQLNIGQVYKFRLYKMQQLHFKHRNFDVPEPRSGHQIVATESNIFVLGGYNPRTQFAAIRYHRRLVCRDVWSFNLATHKWRLVYDERTVPSMPSQLCASSCIKWGNAMISYGGTGFPFGESRSNDCVLYTTGQNATVTKLAVTGNVPPPVYGAAIAIHDNSLYVIGGTTGYDFYCHVHRLDLKTLVWSIVNRLGMEGDPIGRYGHQIINDGNHLFLFGGGTAQTACIQFKILQAFNLKTHCWESFSTYPDLTPGSYFREITGYPRARNCFGCAQYKRSNGDVEVIISGGSQCDSRTFFADVWKINMRTKKWNLLPSAQLPNPIHFHSAACSELGAMYLFGGISSGVWAMKRRNDVYKMWVSIPKLSEICWDALQFYNKNLARYGWNTLHEIGIPQHFLKRMFSLD